MRDRKKFREFELEEGESVTVGDVTFSVVEVDDPDVGIRIDGPSEDVEQTQDGDRMILKFVQPIPRPSIPA